MSKWVDIDDISLLKTVSVGGLSAKALWKRIRQQPSIDLVRCIECIRWENGRVDFSNCELMGIVKPDGFCSEGKRRESEYPCKRCKHRKVPKADYPCEYCYEGDRYEPQAEREGE